jgi:hypothetical protein
LGLLCDLFLLPVEADFNKSKSLGGILPKHPSATPATWLARNLPPKSGKTLGRTSTVGCKEENHSLPLLK